MMKREGKIKDRIKAHCFGNYFNLMQYLAISLLLLGLSLMKLSLLGFDFTLPYYTQFTVFGAASPSSADATAVVPLASASPSRLESLRSHWLVLLLIALANGAAQALSWFSMRLLEWLSPGKLGTAAAQELCYLFSCVSSASASATPANNLLSNLTASNATLAIAEPSRVENLTTSVEFAGEPFVEKAGPASEAEQWLGESVQTAGRVLVAAATVLFYCRVLHFFMINKELGPKASRANIIIYSYTMRVSVHPHLQRIYSIHTRI